MSKASWLLGGLGYLPVVLQFPVIAASPPSTTIPIAEPSSDAPNASALIADQPIHSPHGVVPIAPPEQMPEQRCSTLSCEVDVDDTMGLVRSVDELTDIRPTDWAYQALKSLIERHGMSVGYPAGLFRGNRTLTRYEFAAAVSQVLDKVEEAIGKGQIAQLRDDFNTLRRLQTAYGEIATSLKARLDRLEQATAKLDREAFSPTTRLSGQAVFALTDGNIAKSTVLSRVRLNLKTSFSGQDLLVTQLEAGNNGSDTADFAHSRRQNLLGTNGVLADGGGLDYVGVSSGLRLSKLYYTFNPLPALSVTVGAKLAPRDFIDFNRFANASATNFSSSFFANNPLIVQNAIDQPGGAGAVVAWKSPSLPLTLRALYVAADADRPNLTTGGLFGDRRQHSLELEYAFTRQINVRLQYTGATINGTRINAGGINAEWALNPDFAVFGRFGIGSYQGFNTVLSRDLDLSPKTWSLGFFVRKLVIPGSTAGLAIGQPFITKGLGNATQTNVELFYSFLINDNTSFTPTLLFISNPNNTRDRSIFEWAIRMVYSF